MRRPALALAALLLLPLALPHAAGATTTLDAGGAGGTGWVAWRIQSDGQPLVATVRGHEMQGLLGGGFMLFGPSGALLFAEADAYDPDAHGLSWSARSVGVGTLRQTVVPDASGLAGVTRTLTLTTSPGAWTLLAYVSGDAASWDHSLVTQGGATLLGKTSGSRTMLLDMASATGGAAARADVFSPAGARVDAQSVATLQQLAGFYATTVSAGVDLVRVDGPTGEVACQKPGATLVTFARVPCSYANARGGTHRVTLTGAALGPKEDGEFLLLGADARLPS